MKKNDAEGRRHLRTRRTILDTHMRKLKDRNRSSFGGKAKRVKISEWAGKLSAMEYPSQSADIRKRDALLVDVINN